MNIVLRLFLIISVFILILGLGFSAYAQFLLDYSLENLEFSITHNNGSRLSETSVHQKAVYETLLEDLAFEEIGREDRDAEQLVLLELANRSYEEGEERGGFKRSEIYLNQVYASKKKDRETLLQILDHLYSYWNSASDFLQSFWHYLTKSFLKKEEKFISTDYSSQFLLNRARALEKDWKLEEALALYREYLGRRPKRNDYGYVQISMAQLLMKVRRLREAENTLNDVYVHFTHSEEGRIAKKLLNKIKVLRSRKALISQLESVLRVRSHTGDAPALRLRLALAYLSVYELDKSAELFKRLLRARDTKIRSKAKFYLGWIYKLTFEHEKSEMALLSLGQEQQLEQDLELGLRAQLADIYYQTHDVEKSLEEYRKISEFAENQYLETQKEILRTEAKRKLWLAFSEVEQANIFYFDLNKPEEGAKRLAAARELYGQEFALEIKDLEVSLKRSDWKSIRKYAFKALEKKQLGKAYELFQKNLRYQPKDGWTHSGMSTVLALFGDMDDALKWAKKGWKIKGDAYTASVMAYMYGLWNRYPESLAMYERAVELSPQYVPARFNYACTLLRVKKYENALDVLLALEAEIIVLNEFIRSKVYNNMGYAKWFLGDRSGAAKGFKQALEIRPDFQLAKRNLQQVLRGVGPDIASLKG